MTKALEESRSSLTVRSAKRRSFGAVCNKTTFEEIFRRASIVGISAMVIASGALLVSVSAAQAAKSSKPKPCTAISPTIEAATVRLALNDKYATMKVPTVYPIRSVSERNNKSSSGQCDFYVTVKRPHHAPVSQMVWRFYPYSTRTKTLRHPNLVLPGLVGIENGNSIAAVINGYGGFRASSEVGHATPSEAAALDALAIRWAVAHRVEGSTSTTTSKP